MKKVDFLDLVCAELARMGVEDAEIRIQRQNMDRYLTDMGVGEDSPALDGENPSAFARLICGNIAKKQSGTLRTAVPVAQDEPAGKTVPEPQMAEEFTEEMPNVEAVESDTSVPFADQTLCDGASAPADTYQEDLYADQYGYDTGYADFDPEENASNYESNDYAESDVEYVFAPEDSNGTIEFDVTAIKKKPASPPAGQLEEEEDYFEKNDDDEYVPSGNPALFWVLVGLTSFLWIPLALVLAVAIGLAFVLMLIFEAVYIPGLVAVIIGGSAISFAELIYSIIKFAGKNPSVALFELGLGFLVAAITFGLPTVMYYLGVSIFPGYIKNYGKNVKKLLRKLRRLYRKLKGVCSI